MHIFILRKHYLHILLLVVHCLYSLAKLRDLDDTKRISIAAKLQTRSREVLGSKLDQDTA
jgi:hypothetical protein